MAALQSGAIGYLLRNTPSDELAAKICAVCKGSTQLGSRLVEKLHGFVIPTLPTS